MGGGQGGGNRWSGRRCRVAGIGWVARKFRLHPTKAPRRGRHTRKVPESVWVSVQGMERLTLAQPRLVQARLVAVAPHPLSPLVVASLKHVLVALRYTPVVALPLSSTLAWNLDKAFIETEVVSYRVLPALGMLCLVVGELGFYPIVYLTQFELVLS